MIGDEHYVYHAPVEPSPRATASGGQNVIEARISEPAYIAHGVHAAEIERPGYVFHPLGALMDNPIVRSLSPYSNVVPVRPVGFPITHPDGPTPICPAWGCGGPPIARWPITYGSTATTPQPPPSAGGSQVVPLTTTPPISPAPSPTVAVGADQTAPQLTQPGTVLDSSGATISTASGIGGWLAQSTLISGLPNWGIAAAGLLAAVMMFGGKAGRR